MKPLILFLLGWALIPASLVAQTFEGKVTMAIKTSESENAPLINYSVKDDFMRMDSTVGGQQSSVIFDLKNRQMIVLIPQRSMYMVQPMPSADSAQGAVTAEQEGQKPDSPTFAATGETDTILGYSCKKYVVTSPEGTTEIWATDQLGTFGGFNLGGRPGSRSKIPQGWAAALQGKNVFPMRVIGSHDGKSFRMDVTAVEKRDIPDSEFAPPDGWQKFDMGNFMQGMGAGSFQR